MLEAPTQVIPFAHGTAQLTTWQAGEIQFYHRRIEYDSVQPVAMHNPEELCLAFNLSGSYEVWHEGAGRTVTPGANCQNILYAPDTPVRVQSHAASLSTLCIQLPTASFPELVAGGPAPLQRFAEQVAAGRLALLAPRWERITPAMHQLIEDIMHCRFAGQLRTLFLRAKCLELLVLQAEAATAPAPGPRALKAGPLLAAREYVSQHLHQPPSLREVAQAVGLNEYALKRGFRELFGETVFTYLTRCRLEVARTLLLDTPKTAAEIGYELGYSSPQHFNNAFKKQYGQPPQLYKG